MKKVLLIGDLVGYEKIAISAMIPILSNMDCNVNTLLTSVVSNNFNYGKSEVQDLTDFMRNSFELWKEYGFKFDIIFTGYLTSMEQVKIIEELIEFNDNPLVITDPIMGDHGELYNNVTEEVKKYTRAMVDSADIIIPNLTEAVYLLNKEYSDEYTEEDIYEILNELSNGEKSIIITSVHLDGKNYVYGIDNYKEKDNEIFRVEYEVVPFNFTGTGDIFSSLVLGKIAQDVDLKSAVKYACEKITEILTDEAKTNDSKEKSVHIEKYVKSL